MKDTVFYHEGKPFFTIGAQAHNSSGYALEELEPVWRACRLMEVNTCAIAVSWERFEPREGVYDKDIVRSIIRACRGHGLKLVLLWFGTWKNGHMKYAPEWVKTDRRRFWRVLTHDGYEIANLSSFCEETQKADARAFCRLMEAVREEDAQEKTVLAVQIENELGIVGRSVRDYGAAAQAEYEAQVPQEVVEHLKTGADSEQAVQDWKACGAREKGSWRELFGRRGDELLQAYSMARYVDRIAAAGKAVYPLPMYTNVWLDIQSGFGVPGTDYPSGEAVIRNLAFWRWFAPHLDMICPDLYIQEASRYMTAARAYSRADNPLYIPETGTSMASAIGVFRAIAECGLTGVHFFGAESVLDQKGELAESAKPMHEDFQCLNAVLPLLTKYRGSGRIHAVIQEEFASEQTLHLDGWEAIARFGPFARGGDYRHRAARPTTGRGRGLVIQTGENEFYICGIAFSLAFRSNPPLWVWKAPQQDYQQEHFLDYLHVEEGRFGPDGNWICERIRNGDETDFGVYVFPDNGAVRVVLDGENGR